MRSGSSRMLLAVMAAAASAGFFCAAAAGEKTGEVDVLKLIRIPSTEISAVLERFEKSKDARPAHVRLRIVDETGLPAKARKVTIKWAKGSMELTSDDNGSVFFDLTREKADGLRLILPDGLKAGSESGGIAAMADFGGPGEPLVLPVSPFCLIEGVKVYHPEGMEKAAQAHAPELKKIREFLALHLRTDFMSDCSIALYDRPFTLLVAEQTVVPLPVFKGSRAGMGGQTVMFLIHEWVELSLSGDALDYGRHPDIRCVGDGLAETITFEYCRRAYPRAAAEHLGLYRGLLKQMKRRGVTTYDFIRDFPALGSPAARKVDDDVMSTGYAASFVFWHRLISAEKSPLNLAVLTEWMVKTGKPDLPAVMARVKELTGRDVETKMSIEEVEKYLSSLTIAPATRPAKP